ncbi:ATP-binding cassette domain-containing protein [Auritidibacter ignavus]|uniref:ATP-binding cassette domain-containing protein n=1 Tax=Auritidibacter ignavus TaxID=678932 RepID=UPI001FBAF363|nr:ATP-binding cassette domain-containing protein [Auritidibacter ignavus]WHS35857.1 ATP-binding cassette domain-containing protein [Auritidibacter ignavus]
MSKSFADRRVFTDISFVVPQDDCVGVIGENGAGKSTLLRIIAGHLSADAGQVEIFHHDTVQPAVGLLSQQPSFAASGTMEDVLETAVAPLRAAVCEVDDAAQALADRPHQEAAMVRYTEALDRAERFAAWDVDAHVNRMVAGLGLADVELLAPVGQLSGGQTARLALASLLLSAPDVLLLDEANSQRGGIACVLTVQEYQRSVGDGGRPRILCSHSLVGTISFGRTCESFTLVARGGGFRLASVQALTLSATCSIRYGSGQIQAWSGLSGNPLRLCCLDTARSAFWNPPLLSNAICSMLPKGKPAKPFASTWA